MKYIIAKDDITVATINAGEHESTYYYASTACKARVIARLIASYNPDTTIVMWHMYANNVAEKEYIQKKGDNIEFDEADDGYNEDLNRWYAVQVGDDTDCGSGSEDYKVALDIARFWAKEYPGEEVRIVHCTLHSNFADDVEIIQEGKHE